jgi:mannose-6-phosphate isomerase
MKIPSIIPLWPNRVWRTYEGGKYLDRLENKPMPLDTHYPEDWIGSVTRAINKGQDNPEFEGLSKIVVDGEKILLKDLIESYPEEMLGTAHLQKYGHNTRFLLKFLDSSIRLHIQCHPTVEFSQKYLDSDFGKTEVYYIVQTRDSVKDPYIYFGFQHPPCKQNFRDVVENQDINKLLSYFEKIPVKPGDCFIVPGGLPHAIGEGILMIETMEPSDFSVRVEFQRGDYLLPYESRFLNRSLEFALSMFNFDELPIDVLKSKFFIKSRLIKQYNETSREYILVDESVSDRFRINKIEIKGTIERSDDSFYVAVITKGNGRLSSGNLKFDVKFGDRFFIPYETGNITYYSEEGMNIFLALPPA